MGEFGKAFKIRKNKDLDGELDPSFHPSRGGRIANVMGSHAPSKF